MHIDYTNPSTPLPQRVTRARAKGLSHPAPAVPPLKIQAIKRAMEEDMAADVKKPGRKRRSVYGAAATVSRTDETSLYYIIMHSKCSLQVNFFYVNPQFFNILEILVCGGCLDREL